jgi:hypothetical protein
MPETHDFHAIIDAVDAVNYAIGAENYFAQMWALKLGNEAATLGKGRERQSCVE